MLTTAPGASSFEVLERLGGGGMAEVLLGRAKGGTETGFVKLVAIKRIHPWVVARDRSLIEMLLDEARIAANLSHINIAQTYDLRRSGESYFIVMEYIHGVNLRRINSFFSKRATPAPIPMVAYLMTNICAGLEYAHTMCDGHGRPMRFIHRNVSPDNVMVSFEGEVKLIDFGIALAAQRLHRTLGGQVKGKPVYMSPEQASGEAVDHRSDIYSAGLVLYEMLTLHNPLQEESGLNSMRMKCATRPRIPPPSAVVPAIPEKLERICIKALAVDPVQRFSSAAAMERELYEFLRAHPYSRQQLAGWLKESLAEDQARLQKILSGLRTPPVVHAHHDELQLSTPEVGVCAESAHPVPLDLKAPTLVSNPDRSTDQLPRGAEHLVPTLVEPTDETPTPLMPTGCHLDEEGRFHSTPLDRPGETPTPLMPTGLYRGGAESLASTRLLEARGVGRAGAPLRRRRRWYRLTVFLAVGGALAALALFLFVLIASPGPLESPSAPPSAVDASVEQP